MSSRWNSRKYKSAWGLTWLITALLVVPWLVDLCPLLVLTALVSEGTWTMVVMGVWGAYFASNVATKGVYAWENTKIDKVNDASSE